MLESPNSRCAYSKPNIQNAAMFPFDQYNAAQHNRFVELENALRVKNEAVTRLRAELEEMQNTVRNALQFVKDQHKHYEELTAGVFQTMQAKNKQMSMLQETLLGIKDNVNILERENAMYKSMEARRQLR